MVAEGKEVGKAYVTIRLDDQTTADYEKLRSELESKPDLSLGTKLGLPDNADFERIKAVTEAKGDITLRTRLDSSQAEQGLKSLADTADESAKKAQSSMTGLLTSTTTWYTTLGLMASGPAVALSLGAIAGGFAAIGVAAEKSSPQVVQAFNTVKTEGADTLQASFRSLTPAIVSSLNTMTNAVRGLGPAFENISAAIGPSFSIITNGIVQAAQTAIPAMSSALYQATPMAHALAGGINDVATGFAQFLGRLDFSQATQGLASLLRDVGQLEPVVASLLNAVMPLGNALLSSVVPAVTTLVGGLVNGLAPAIGAVGGAIQALSPVLDFMAGPAASVLIGVAAFKGLEAAATPLLSAFNSVSSAASNYGSKLISLVGGSDNAIGSFTLMTDAQKKAAVQSASSALASAQQAAATAASNLATLESAAAADAASVSQEQLAAARTAATVTAEAETAATVAVNEASAATSFALGPVGIGLGVVAGLMTLFAGNTDKALPPVTNFTAQLDKLATAAPGAAQGILASSPGLSDLVNKASAAGLSVNELSTALDQGGAAQAAVQSKLNGTVTALGQQQTSWNETVSGGKAGNEVMRESTITIAELSAKVGDSSTAFQALSPAQKEAVTQFRNAQSVLGDLNGMFAQNATTQHAAATVGAQAVQLTADQQAAATQVAQQFGLSIGDVAAAFAKLPGAGSTAVGAVLQVTQGFQTGEIALKNAEQGITDYFAGLQRNADQANQALSSANHSYQQSIQAVADAQHSFTQSQMAVETANQGVATATRAVTDAVHSYEQAQHSVAQANQSVIDAENGVVTAEQNLTNAQRSETQAQLALTDARAAATQQLKSLNLQLNDQVVAEQRAQMNLFDQTRTAASHGVTVDNAASILAQPTTIANEALKQSALDLVSAENSLADTLNTGANLRDQVNKANKAGVDGNPQVVSAEQALQNSQQQVASSQLAVVKAHQAVDNAVYSLQQSYYALGKAQQAITDAQTGVVRAQQAVRDAVYAEEKARIAVKDAIYNEQQALIAVRTAQENATKANDLNSNSLDLNTQAGRNNQAQLETLFGAFPKWWTDQQRFNAMVDETSTKFHMSRDAAIDYLKSIHDIPQDYRYSVTAVASMDAQGLFNDITAPTSLTGRRQMYAEGGPISGPGGPKADMIPIMASHGEYMQPADVVDHYGVGFMEALRQKKVPRGGDGASLPGFAAGGLVQANEWFAAAGDKYQAAVNAMEVIGFNHPAGLPKYVPPPVVDYTGGSGVSQWTPQVLQALSMLGQSAALLPNVLRRMNQESGGNPNVVNRWDSNWAAGTPSVGLMQVIGPTFRSNAGPMSGVGPFSYGVSVDPLANIYAGLHYAENRYPSLQYAMDKPGGYDNGGFMLDKPALNSTGRPEMILPPDLTNTLMSIHQMVQSGQSGQATGSSVSMPIHITTVPMDPHETASAVSAAVTWNLRR